MIELKIELPFNGINQRLLQQRVANEFASLTVDVDYWVWQEP